MTIFFILWHEKQLWTFWEKSVSDVPWGLLVRIPFFLWWNRATCSTRSNAIVNQLIISITREKIGQRTRWSDYSEIYALLVQWRIISTSCWDRSLARQNRNRKTPQSTGTMLRYVISTPDCAAFSVTRFPVMFTRKFCSH